MAASLNELLRPTRFDADPNSPKAAKQLKHWLKVFTDFLESCERLATAQEVAAPDKLRALTAYVSADVYDIIEDCTMYDTAIAKLNGAHIKTPNPIFARHVLATRKQKQAEPLQTFMQELLILRKDVTAEEYRNLCVTR